MPRSSVLAIPSVVLAVAALTAQATIVTGDRSTALRPLAGGRDIGISNAVLRNQPEVRVLRVVADGGGKRVMHAHDDVKFHLFVPISGPMTLELEGQPAVDVAPWHPFYMTAGTRHGFQNSGAAPVEILEIFVR
jgi:quercetin dioxygenase-like cupin family protein